MTFKKGHVPPPARNQCRWTSDEDDKLIRLHTEDVPFPEIALRLHRKVRAIKSRMKAINGRMAKFDWTVEIDGDIIFGHFENQPMATVASLLDLPFSLVQTRQAFLFRDTTADTTAHEPCRRKGSREWTEEEDKLIWAQYINMKNDAAILEVFNKNFSKRTYNEIEERRVALVYDPEETSRKHRLSWAWEHIPIRRGKKNDDGGRNLGAAGQDQDIINECPSRADDLGDADSDKGKSGEEKTVDIEAYHEELEEDGVPSGFYAMFNFRKW